MILTRQTLAGIAAGHITLAFRRWTRPTVVAGGTLRTAAGELAIEAIDRIALHEISADDARRAGYDSLQALHAELAKRPAGQLFRIRFGGLRPDPRVALRESGHLSADDRRELKARLERMDRASASGPWTKRTLEIIATNPEVRAADLCRHLAQERDDFKRNVRKLKDLGLTESLDVGYRLSKRGRAVLRQP